ncbi:DegT/DnrJ/EryC1/StrS aminotransferase [Candidatus Koribacter versatilis Ellin345]|uniref:DegT/DnrJ/EryC1/StrS aminotransferase n=1 Tax=Koribacter versatilis (strain Ellin345) TaxID=204669 RepID=Q1IIF7_KORVE|nr:DegT/DnrJ/EryC1/StrS family aminotransferase [Candidatus Koribacter versatilis]ABF43343.1 DegT/DnrJ/EryC1/StrS aminotransferase [Candidatus Koribacter versatilis Ellin345]
MPDTSVTTTRIPMLDLKRQFAAIRDEVYAAMQEVCESQHLVLGEAVQAFERESAVYLGAKAAVGCASGTDALWLALVACDVKPGDSVITTSFSFFATASSIIRCGARPVFVDIHPDTLNLDPGQVEAKLYSAAALNLKAVMPVHLYGQCADMDRFERFGRDHSLKIVEDAAQAFGASWRGRRAGTLGHAAGFSFYPTKNLSAFGDGGLVTTNDNDLAEHVRRLRNHGSRVRYYHEELGWNSRLDSIQAAVLRVKLKYIDQWNARRREIAEFYDKLFVEVGLASPANRGGWAAKEPVRLLCTLTQAHHIYHQYVIRCMRRDDLRQHLSSRGIGSEIYYPVPLHMQECFNYLGYRAGDLPHTELAAKEVLALPIFPEITEEEQHRVVDAIREFYR